MIADTAIASLCSYDPSHTSVCKEYAMERFLFLWDELDDLMGASRYYFKNTAIAIWSTVRSK